VQQKVFLKNKLEPEQLFETTKQAYIGINLVEPLGLNQVYSLANKFFDYIQAGVPQLTMNFPEYKKVNDEFEVALLIDTIDVNKIADALSILLTDDALHKKLKENCDKAAVIFNWQQEEKKLLAFYKQVFAD
jgi:glycosyltransferase involved in cell wall biosynthesis